MRKATLISLVSGALLLPALVLAHQPRMPESFPVSVPDPEISKAYYSQLAGKPQVYTIVSDKPFALYVNVLVPDIAGQKKDVGAAVVKDGDAANPLVVLNGQDFQWKKFFEPFGHDTYWMGPEFRTKAGSGRYDIMVYSGSNDSKYSLAIGETEAFDFQETINAVDLIPRLKRDFFNESPANFIFSPFGIGYIIIMFALAFVAALFWRNAAQLASINSGAAGMTNRNRLIAAAIGALLFVWAIFTSWNAGLLFLSGFAFSEIVLSRRPKTAQLSLFC